MEIGKLMRIIKILTTMLILLGMTAVLFPGTSYAANNENVREGPGGIQRVPGGGYGSGSYLKPEDLPSDNLWYSVPFPAYVTGSNGFYIEDATTPRRLTLGVENVLRTDNTKTTTQSISSAKDRKLTFKTELSPILNLARVAMKAYGLFGMKNITGNLLNIDTELTPDIITNTNTVTFNVSQQITVLPKNPRVQARSVYYKQASRGVIYRKNSQGKLEQNGVSESDIVVAQGWILQCGEKQCRPGVDYVNKSADNTKNSNTNSLNESDESYMPRTGKPFSVRKDNPTDWGSIEYPEICSYDFPDEPNSKYKFTVDCSAYKPVKSVVFWYKAGWWEEKPKIDKYLFKSWDESSGMVAFDSSKEIELKPQVDAGEKGSKNWTYITSRASLDVGVYPFESGPLPGAPPEGDGTGDDGNQVTNYNLTIENTSYKTGIYNYNTNNIITLPSGDLIGTSNNTVERVPAPITASKPRNQRLDSGFPNNREYSNFSPPFMMRNSNDVFWYRNDTFKIYKYSDITKAFNVYKDLSSTKLSQDPDEDKKIKERIFNSASYNVSNGKLYVAASPAILEVEINKSESPIRVIAGSLSTSGYAGDEGKATNALLGQNLSLASKDNNLYLADKDNNRVRKVDLQSGIITTVLGGGTVKPEVGQKYKNLKSINLTPQGVYVDPSDQNIKVFTDQNLFNLDSSGVQVIAGITDRSKLSGATSGPATNVYLNKIRAVFRNYDGSLLIQDAQPYPESLGDIRILKNLPKP